VEAQELPRQQEQLHDVPVGCTGNGGVVLQLCVLQLCEVAPSHLGTPPVDVGLLHRRVWMPPPHVAEHVLHVDHTPLMGVGLQVDPLA